MYGGGTAKSTPRRLWEVGTSKAGLTGDAGEQHRTRLDFQVQQQVTDLPSFREEGLVHRHFHLSLNRGGRLGTTDDFTTSFLCFFLCVLHFPLALGELQACPFPDVCCLPTSFSVCLVFFPLLLCLARWFWPDLMKRKTCPYHFSLRLFTMVRRSLYGSIVC